MKKLVALLASLFLIMFMVSCGKKKSDDENSDTNPVNDTDIQDVDDETPDTDDGDGDEETCKLDKNWMTPDSEWAEWGYLRMQGLITTYGGNDYVAADFTEGKMKVGGVTKDFGDGVFQNYQNAIIIADASSYTVENINQSAGTAIINLYDAMWQINKQIIPALKEDNINEVDFAAFVWFRHVYIDVDVNFGTGMIEEQRMRKNCWIGLAATAEYEELGEIYDVPVGGMYGCFEKNVDGSVGETLKMMLRNKMTGDRNDILPFINTKEDETVLEYGDEGFQFECQCYPAEGPNEEGDNDIPCWEYDGPGGTECPLEAEEDGLCGGEGPEDPDDTEDPDDAEDPDDVEPVKPAPEIETDFDADGDYEVGTEMEVVLKMNSQGNVDQLVSIDYEFYKDDVLIDNMSDVATKSEYKIRGLENDIRTTEITKGSGTISQYIEYGEFKDEAAAFTLGMVDTYCVDRNRPVTIYANFKEPGVYKIKVITNKCFNNNPKELPSKFTANTKEGCDGKEHTDAVTKSCKDPEAFNTQTVEFEVKELPIQ
ncbi:MAG: hypothetical protein ACOX2F_12390 [bacterium]